jgi:hypothetical protein
MKKLLFVLFVLGISLQVSAGIKEKDVIGTWSYTVETGEETLKGTLKFEKKEGVLVGEVHTEDGDVFTLTKVEIRDNNALYLELQPEYDILKITLTIDKKSYSGSVSTPEGDVPVTGEKLE